MKNKTLLISGVALGAFLSLGPLWSILYAAHFLPDSNPTNHHSHAPDIAFGMTTSLIGIVLCLVGVPLLVAAVIRLDELKRNTPPPLPGKARL